MKKSKKFIYLLLASVFLISLSFVTTIFTTNLFEDKTQDEKSYSPIIIYNQEVFADSIAEIENNETTYTIEVFSKSSFNLGKGPVASAIMFFAVGGITFFLFKTKFKK